MRFQRENTVFKLLRQGVHRAWVYAFTVLHFRLCYYSEQHWVYTSPDIFAMLLEFRF